MPGDSFCEQYGRTRGYTMGVPREFTVSPDGGTVLFTRSATGSDSVHALWSYDVPSGAERLLFDPAAVGATGGAEAQEAKDLRERMRASGSGVVGYRVDAQAATAVFTLAGQLWIVDLASGGAERLPATEPVVDPRLDPTGTRIGYVSGGAMRVIDRDGGHDRALAVPEDEDVSYGLAELVAAEEMKRRTGYWWSPDGRRLLVARVDNRPVTTWYLPDPSDPAKPPRGVRYPVAGSTNAEVTLAIRGLDGSAVPVDWDHRAHEYLTAVAWDRETPVIAVQNRAQSSLLLLSVDPDSGATRRLAEYTDPAWVTLFGGVPAHTADGALLWVAPVDGTYRLLVDGEPVTPDGLQIREVCGVDGDTVLLRASDEPTEQHLWSWSAATGPVRLTAEPGVHIGVMAGGTLVTSTDTPDTMPAVTVRRDAATGTIASLAETPLRRPRVELLRLGPDALRGTVLYPTGHVPGSAGLPVLLHPYGGPGAQKVQAGQRFYVLSQWFADQGFAVLIADGRGTPGRGPQWDRTIFLDKVECVLDDQVTALHAAAETHPDLDLSRVGIRGWSYGGYLAAAAVLRRDEVFHAASAGAPVCDTRLYDTHYQERYLGHPDTYPEVYARTSLLPDAPRLRRPLLLIHGMSDDNVHPAHTFQLSHALLMAGRQHEVLPLSGSRHGPSGDQKVNALAHEARFLRRSLGVG